MEWFLTIWFSIGIILATWDHFDLVKNGAMDKLDALITHDRRIVYIVLFLVSTLVWPVVIPRMVRRLRGIK